MPRAWIRLILITAALGMLTTFLIAGTCAWFATQFYGRADIWAERLTDPVGNTVVEAKGQAPPTTQYLEFHVYNRFGASFGTSRLRPFQNYTPAAEPPPRTPPESVASRWQRAALLPWLDGRRPWPDPKVGENTWIKASGWPWRCFVCNISRKNAPNFGSHTVSAQPGLVLSNSTFPGWADWPPTFPRIIPLRPMWPELLLNIATFSIAWGLMFYSYTTFRRARRVRRGLCPACAYDRRDLPPETKCPECGIALLDR